MSLTSEPDGQQPDDHQSSLSSAQDAAGHPRAVIPVEGLPIRQKTPDSDPQSSPRSPTRARVTSIKDRVSSMKSIRVTSHNSAALQPPSGNPAMMDSPTRREKSDTSASAGKNMFLTRGEAARSGEMSIDQDLIPRPTWTRVGLKSVPKAFTAKKSSVASLDDSSFSAPFVSETAEEEKTRTLHPGGCVRTVWEILTVMWLLHDVVFIPLQFFDLPESEFLNILSWSTIAFWSVDILMSFRTGVYSKGVLVMDATAVARKYARTWLPVDIMLVSIDWVALALEGSRGQQEGHNVLWILRLLRLVRVVRLGKMSRTALVLQEALQGWAVNVQFSVAMNIIRLLLLNHMIACAWWGFSHIGGKADGWSTQYGVEEEDRLYGYMTSLHWAIAQLGVGATGIEATNLPERIFSIFVALISLITFSTMVSSMTSMMTAYSRSKEEEARHFSLLQRYLLHNKVSTNLSQRITKFLQHAYMAQHKASSQDMHVPLLDMLSRPLMNELQLEKHQKDMERLPFLKAILSWHNVQTVDSMRNLASSSFTVCTVATKDVIFCSGVEALAAYLPITGDVSYLQDGRQAEPCLHVWTAEMCLWTEWYFLGDLIATDVSRILMLDMESFCRAIASNPLMHGMAVQYAKEYTNNLRSEADGADISDTWQFEAEVEVHDFMFGRGFAPELAFNTFGRQRAKGRPGSQTQFGSMPGMARTQVVPDQILE